MSSFSNDNIIMIMLRPHRRTTAMNINLFSRGGAGCHGGTGEAVRYLDENFEFDRMILSICQY
jgi:hypothetical protein